MPLSLQKLKRCSFDSKSVVSRLQKTSPIEHLQNICAILQELPEDITFPYQYQCRIQMMGRSDNAINKICDQ